MYVNPVVVGIVGTLMTEVCIAMIAYWWENRK